MSEAVGENTAQIDIGIDEILRLIPHRPPFLMIDRAEDFQSYKSLVGVKCVANNEPFFGGHFPGFPVMPGVMIIEAIAQTGGVLMSKSMDLDIEHKTILFMSLDNCRFRYPVRPGDVLHMPVEVLRARPEVARFKGRAMVGDSLAAECEFMAMVVERPLMAKIHAVASVDKGARLGDDVEIGPYCTVGPHVTLGARTQLLSHVNLEGRTTIGEDCVIHPFASLGGPPQHAGHNGAETTLAIGDRNLIREHVTMNVGSSVGTGATVVGSDGMYCTGAHVGHDCVVGDQVLLTNLANLAGHVRVGDFAILGGLAGVHQYVRIGRYAFVGALAAVPRDVIPYGTVWGNHAHLDGLNLVGLKRRGFSRAQIHTLRAAYRDLFADEGLFQDRVAAVAARYAASEQVMEVIAFIQADSSRAVCMPQRET